MKRLSAVAVFILCLCFVFLLTAQTRFGVNFFNQSGCPTSGVAVGDICYDTATNLLRVATSIGPVVWSSLDDTSTAQTLTNKTLSNATLGTTALTTTQTSSTAGSTANLLQCFDGTTGKVIDCATSATGALGIAKTTQTSTQSVEVATRGQQNCVADNTTTVGNLLGVGTTTAGRCKDLGQTSSISVSSSLQVIGRALTAVSAGSNVSVQLFGPGHYGAQPNVANGTGVLPAANGGARFLLGFMNSASPTTDDYFPILGGTQSATEANLDVVGAPYNMTCRNLTVFINTAPGSGNSWIVTLRTGSPGSLSNTALTCTMSNTTTCTDAVNSVAITAGQVMTVFFDANTTVTGTGGQGVTIECGAT